MVAMQRRRMQMRRGRGRVTVCFWCALSSTCGGMARTEALMSEANGLLAVYKPRDWTSANVVSKIRNTLERAARLSGSRAEGESRKKRQKIKVGHGGTLDPMATGVLVLGVGSGCRQLEGYLSGGKEYVARGMLGAETDTLDAEGEVVEEAMWRDVTREDLGAAIDAFRGDILQTPPMYSALKKDGERLYDLARRGVQVERQPRTVHIARLDLIDFHPPAFDIAVECGGGTYIRSLIADIARHDRVSSRAHMVMLERTRQGPFTLADCLHQDEWTADAILARLALNQADHPVTS